MPSIRNFLVEENSRADRGVNLAAFNSLQNKETNKESFGKKYYIAASWEMKQT